MRLSKPSHLPVWLAVAALALAAAACKSDEQKLAEFLERGEQAQEALA